FPEMYLDEISIHQEFNSLPMSNPFFVAAITAGNKKAGSINYNIAKACSSSGWIMMVGSQRRELFDSEEGASWKEVFSDFPDVKRLGNIGLTQIKQAGVDKIIRLIESIGASGFCVHTNPLQEAIQEEGTPFFKSSLEALKELVKASSVPVIIKETGSGFSEVALRKLIDVGIYAVDLSGTGGTHWGRVEGLRSDKEASAYQSGQVFKDWGVSSFQSLLNAKNVELPAEYWVSGGLKNGLEAAKYLAFGAKRVGFARTILDPATHNSDKVLKTMQQIEKDLKIAMFCSGSKNLAELKDNWQWVKK
ncbi:MAG: type 2 isopentenyl-diphosphate Delta-isomerase, partial [Bdellovibrionales bacterium]